MFERLTKYFLVRRFVTVLDKQRRQRRYVVMRRGWANRKLSVYNRDALVL